MALEKTGKLVLQFKNREVEHDLHVVKCEGKTIYLAGARHTDHKDFRKRYFPGLEKILSQLPKSVKMAGVELVTGTSHFKIGKQAARKRLVPKPEERHLAKEMVKRRGKVAYLDSWDPTRTKTDIGYTRAEKREIRASPQIARSLRLAGRDLPVRHEMLEDRFRDLNIANNIRALAKTQDGDIFLVLHPDHAKNVAFYLQNPHTFKSHMKSVGRAATRGRFATVKWQGPLLVSPTRYKGIRKPKCKMAAVPRKRR